MFHEASMDSFDTSSIRTPSIVRSKQDHYDYLAKVILVGPSGCGKSSIFHRFVKGEWNILTSQTIGVEFSSKILSLGPQQSSIAMKMQLWDTAGQERFRSLTRGYYRGSAGVLLVFDVSDRSSFESLREFMVDIKNLTEPSVSIVLVGNKSDIAEATEVSREEALQFCVKYSHELETDIPLMYASALRNENVTESFEKLAYSILTKVELGTVDPENMNSGVQYGDLPFYYTEAASAPDNRKRALAALRRKQSLTLSLNKQEEPHNGWTCC